jgi:hypothetical protein
MIFLTIRFIDSRLGEGEVVQTEKRNSYSQPEGRVCYGIPKKMPFIDLIIHIIFSN